MPITRFTASADTTITNAYKPLTTSRAYYANMGAADSLEMFCIYQAITEQEKSRILINFPFEKISSSLESGEIPQEARFYLRLFNVQHPETLPKNYYASVKAISSSWDEGLGLDMDNYLDNGQTLTSGYGANWKFRSTTETQLSWSQDGGDFIDDSEVNYYFDNGTEDLIVDVTDTVFKQVSLEYPRDGFAIMLSGAFEDGTNKTDYYTKRFSARSSEYFYKRPVLEARWEATVKDDRNDFYFESANLNDQDNTQNIYFYNRVNGVLKDVKNNPNIKVDIKNSSGLSLATPFDADRLSTGVYRASVIVTGSTNDLLNDVWYSGSTAFFTGSIEAKVRIFDDTFVEDEYIFNLKNLKNSYKPHEKASIRVFSRQKNWNPNIYTIATSEVNVTTIKELYYKIFRIVDNMTIIDYGVEPVAYTKCSYDKNGNYFDLDMSIFEPGYMYGIRLMKKNGDSDTEYQNIFKFKVE